jgi:hypothetical protein
MPAEAPVRTDPIKERLEKLEQYMPGDPILYQFARNLSGKIKGETLVSLGFAVAAEAALRSYNGHMTSIRSRIPDIADATCPPEFARNVREFYGRTADKTVH